AFAVRGRREERSTQFEGDEENAGRREENGGRREENAGRAGQGRGRRGEGKGAGQRRKIKKNKLYTVAFHEFHDEGRDNL
ncbi:hypothetical protein KI387_013043, partial [Taxus chinensis]